MDNFQLDVNDRLEVIAKDKAYKSLITDVDDDWIKINVPVFEGEYLVLYSGEMVIINMYLDNGKCYSFNAKVYQKEKKETYRITNYQNLLILKEYKEEIILE